MAGRRDPASESRADRRQERGRDSPAREAAPRRAEGRAMSKSLGPRYFGASSLVWINGDWYHPIRTDGEAISYAKLQPEDQVAVSSWDGETLRGLDVAELVTRIS